MNIKVALIGSRINHPEAFDRAKRLLDLLYSLKEEADTLYLIHTANPFEEALANYVGTKYRQNIIKDIQGGYSSKCKRWLRLAHPYYWKLSRANKDKLLKVVSAISISNVVIAAPYTPNKGRGSLALRLACYNLIPSFDLSSVVEEKKLAKAERFNENIRKKKESAESNKKPPDINEQYIQGYAVGTRPDAYVTFDARTGGFITFVGNATGEYYYTTIQNNDYTTVHNNYPSPTARIWGRREG